MHVIRATERDGELSAWICDRGDYAHLVIIGASKMTEQDWDEMVRLCHRVGWEPDEDDPDLFYGPADLEAYLLTGVTYTEREEDTDGDTRALEPLIP